MVAIVPGITAMLIGMAAMLAPGGSEQADPASLFTSRFFEDFRAAYPDLPLTITGPLTLGNGKDGAINLDRVYNFCAGNPAAACETMRQQFMTGIAAQLAAEKDPSVEQARPENLRLLVRAGAFCTMARSQMAAAPRPTTAAVGPFVGDLCLALMFDFPTTRRLANLEDLPAIGLEREAAWALGRCQVLAGLPKVAGLDIEEGSLNLLADLPDVNSLVLDSEGWAALAARHPGKTIIVTQPDDGVLTVMIGGSPKMIAGLKRLTAENFRTAGRGISPGLLQWTANGWQPVP